MQVPDVRTEIIKAYMAGQKTNGDPVLREAVDYYNAAFPIDFDKVSIKELGLSGVPKNLLKHHRINVIGEIIAMSDEDLMALHGVGKKSLTEIRAKVKEWAERNK